MRWRRREPLGLREVRITLRMCIIWVWLNSTKMEIEDTPKVVEISAVKRGTRSRQIGNVKSGDTVLEEMRRQSRSKMEAIGGDSFLELEMVLNQARKSRAKKKMRRNLEMRMLNT